MIIGLSNLFNLSSSPGILSSLHAIFIQLLKFFQVSTVFLLWLVFSDKKIREAWITRSQYSRVVIILIKLSFIAGPRLDSVQENLTTFIFYATTISYNGFINICVCREAMIRGSWPSCIAVKCCNVPSEQQAWQLLLRKNRKKKHQNAIQKTLTLSIRHFY